MGPQWANLLRFGNLLQVPPCGPGEGPCVAALAPSLRMCAVSFETDNYVIVIVSTFAKPTVDVSWNVGESIL